MRVSTDMYWPLPAAAVIPSVTARIFQAWSCEGFGTTVQKETFYLRQDWSIVCYDSKEHRDVESVAYVLMALWYAAAMKVPFEEILQYLRVLVVEERSHPHAPQALSLIHI